MNNYYCFRLLERCNHNIQNYVKVYYSYRKESALISYFKLIVI